MAFDVRRVVQSLLATGVVQVTGVASGILIARLMGPEDRGYLAQLIAWYAFLSPLALIGADDGATYLLSNRPERRRQLLASSFAALGLTSLIGVACCGLAFLFMLRDAPAYVQAAALTYLLFPPIYQLAQLTQVMLQTGGEYGSWNMMRLLGGPLYILGILGLAAVGDLQPIGAVAAQLASILVVGLAATLIVFRRWRPLAPRFADIKEMFAFGRFSMFQRLTIVTRDNLDRMLLPLFVSMTSLGHYAVAASLGYVVFLVGFTLDLVAFPTVAAARAEDRVHLAGIFIRVGLTAGLMAGAATMVLIGPLIRFLLGPEFIPSIPLAQLLVVAGTLQSYKMSLGTVFKAFGRPKLLAAVETSATVALVIGLIVLTPLVGLVGACYASILAAAASAAGLMALSVIKLGMPLSEFGLIRPSDVRNIVDQFRPRAA